MSADLSILDLFLQASLLVKCVMLLLLGLSVASWAIIFQRRLVLKQANKRLQEFEDRFWAGTDPKTLFDALSVRRSALSGLEHIFHSGYQEYLKMKEQLQDGANVDSATLIDATLRSMRVALARESERLESQLSFLATVGSISPYIGLFGTVWGIMQSFMALGQVQQATLAMVAPGIAEALIATAMGLFAAIPAVMAYNRFAHSADKIINHYDNFVEEATALFRRRAVMEFA